ncbi:MAG: PaaI family thioesterase [Pseudomonadales bacterium]|nr:PaaI family thioesterase [Pseudomonadales bacterium]
MKNKKQIIEEMNNQRPEFIRLLGGTMIDFSDEMPMCTFEFDIGKEYCHSIDIVQGGFITAMLDVVMSHSIFVQGPELMGLSSLEIKTSYLEPTRAGKLRVEGCILKQSYKMAFLEGRMYNAENTLTATASTVAKLIRPK